MGKGPNLGQQVRDLLVRMSYDSDDMWIQHALEEMYGTADLPSQERYKFPVYIRNKETKLVYKLLTSYEDRPAGLYTRQDDFESRTLLQRWDIEKRWEVLDE